MNNSKINDDRFEFTKNLQKSCEPPAFMWRDGRVKDFRRTYYMEVSEFIYKKIEGEFHKNFNLDYKVISRAILSVYNDLKAKMIPGKKKFQIMTFGKAKEARVLFLDPVSIFNYYKDHNSSGMNTQHKVCIPGFDCTDIAKLFNRFRDLDEDLAMITGKGLA